MPYAIDFLNPAPDFERDRITRILFRPCRGEDGEARDRPRAARRTSAVVAALGGDARNRRCFGLHRRTRCRACKIAASEQRAQEPKARERFSAGASSTISFRGRTCRRTSPGTRLLRPDVELSRGVLRRSQCADARREIDIRRSRPLPVSASVLSQPPTTTRASAKFPKRSPRSASAS